jgi:hypothetical protein
VLDRLLGPLYQMKCNLASEVLDRPPIYDTIGSTMQLIAQAMPQNLSARSLPAGGIA